MQHHINPRVKAIQISGIRQFFNLVRTVPDAISLTIGQPDFPTPHHVKQAGMAAIRDNHTTYTENAGLLVLRRAISDFLMDKYNLAYDPDSEVIVTHGTTEAIAIALMTILEPDAEVILPAPIYPGYAPLVELFGGRVVLADTRETDFQLTADSLRQHLTAHTRAVVLPYPSNPTGAVFSDDNRIAVAKLLADRGIYAISDEVYSELRYDGAAHRSIASEPGMRDLTIVLNGVSKSHAMTGWRIGFVCAPSELSTEMLKVHQYLATCASSISQHAALEALQHGRDDASEMRTAYQQRRDFMVTALSDMGLPLTAPQGAFYLFPSVAQTKMTSFEFAQRLLLEARVAVVPGDAFSVCGEGYIRVSYAVGEDRLTEAVARMRAFLAGYFPDFHVK